MDLYQKNWTTPYKKTTVRKKQLLVKKEIINVMTDMKKRKQKDSTVVM